MEGGDRLRRVARGQVGIHHRRLQDPERDRVNGQRCGRVRFEMFLFEIYFIGRRINGRYLER